jgi:hypothetical protein
MALALLVGAAAPVHADTRTYFGFTIGLGNAPPPPRVVYVQHPHTVFVPEEQVYVVDDPGPDCDVFSYGPYWYMSSGDFWYRSRSYRGPFVSVDVRTVPRPIFAVPAERWHHYPRSLERWHGDHDNGRGHAWGRYKEHDRGDDDDHGKGHGHGHGRDDS